MHNQPVLFFLRSLSTVLVALCLGVASGALAQTQYERFAGRLADKDGLALAGAIKINGSRKITAPDGTFEIYVPTNTRYVIEATRNGFVPYSIIHTGVSLENMEIRLTRAEIFNINPTQNIDVTDSRGTRLTIPAGSLVDAQGRPAPASLQLQLYTYDLRNEQMVGDMSGVDVNGQPVVLQSIGAFSAEFRDANGVLYNLAAGRTASISLRADPANTFSGTVPLWWYDQARGLWVEEGAGTVVDGVAIGEVRHFTVWNFDIKFSNPACIKLTIDPMYFYGPAGGSLQIRAKVPAPWFRDQILTINNPGPHALYNLPANVTVEFLVNGAPYALINTGAAFGGTGIPPYPYEVCQGKFLNVNGTPQTALIQGKVLRQYRNSHGAVTVRVRNSTTMLGSTATDAAGNFSLQVPPGTVSIIASRAGHLSAQRPSLTLTGGGVVTLPTVTLFGGNVDSDNDIDWTDISAIGPYVTAPPASATSTDTRDVNGNFLIDWDDVTKASANGGLMGPSTW
jgi:hypothetical protein